MAAGSAGGSGTTTAGGATSFLLGTSAGDVLGVSLVGGSGGRSAPGEGVVLEEGLPVGLEALMSSDEEDEDE